MVLIMQRGNSYFQWCYSKVCLPLKNPSTQSKVYGEIRSNMHNLPHPSLQGYCSCVGAREKSSEEM